MSDNILIAIISGLCVAVPSVIATWKSSGKANALMQYKINDMDIKINEMSKKIDSNNEALKKTIVLEQKIKSMNYRINDLEHKGEN